MEEKELIRHLTGISQKEGYRLIPESELIELDNMATSLRRDMMRARESRDRYKAEIKELKIKIKELKKNGV